MRDYTRYVKWVSLVGGTLLLAMFAVAWRDGSRATATGAATASYIGITACKACHGKVYDPWSASAHGKALANADLPAELKGCEACHGPGSIHAGSREKNKPPIPKVSDQKAVNDVCGTCHFTSDSAQVPAAWQKLSRVNFANSRHGRKGLSCLACHKGHADGTEKALRRPAEQLCVTCHASVLEDTPGKKASYTHMPVAQRQCLMCHDPHGGDGGSMVVKDIAKVCQGCHDTNDPSLQSAHLNYPMADADCTSCHNPHSHNRDGGLMQSKQHVPFKSRKCETCHGKSTDGKPAGLVKPAKDLCVTCHKLDTLLPQDETAHVPVKSGMCVSCHNPHVSTEKALLKDKLANVCFTCHKKVKSDTMASHKHKVLEENMDCGLCHKPHSSAQRKMLVKDEMALCGQCHKHSFSHPMDRRKDGTEVLDPTTGKRMICSNCHEVHGSQFEKLTIGSKDRDLCLKCHKVDH